MSKIGRSETFPNNRNSAHVSKPGLFGKLKRRFRLSNSSKGKYDIAECSESGSLSSIDSAGDNGTCVMTRTSSLDCSDSLSSNGTSSLDEAVQMRYPNKVERAGSSADVYVENRRPDEIQRRICEENTSSPTHLAIKSTLSKRFSENIYRASLELISEKPMEKLKIMEHRDICNDFLEADENAIDLDDDVSCNTSQVYRTSHKKQAPELKKQDSYLLSESLDDPGYESLEKIREQVSRQSAAAQNYGTSTIYSDIDNDGNLVSDSDVNFPNKENLVSKSSLDSGLESANHSMSSNEICQQFDEVNSAILNGDRSSSENSYQRDSRKSSEDLSVQISNACASSQVEDDPDEIYSNYRVHIRKQMMSQNLDSVPVPVSTTDSLDTPHSESSSLAEFYKPFFEFNQTFQSCANHSDLHNLCHSIELDESGLSSEVFDSPPPIPERKYSRIDLDESRSLNGNGDLSSSSDTSFSKKQCSIIETDEPLSQTSDLNKNQSNNHVTVSERISDNTFFANDDDSQCSCNCHVLQKDETNATDAQLPDSGNNIDSHDTYQTRINDQDSDNDNKNNDVFKLRTKHSVTEIISSGQCLDIDLLSTSTAKEDKVIIIQGDSAVPDLPPKNGDGKDMLLINSDISSKIVDENSAFTDRDQVVNVSEENSNLPNVSLSTDSRIDVDVSSHGSNSGQECLNSSAETMQCIDSNSTSQEQYSDKQNHVQIVSDNVSPLTDSRIDTEVVSHENNDGRERLNSSVETAQHIDNKSTGQEQYSDQKKCVQIISDDKTTSMVLIASRPTQHIVPSLRPEIVEDNDDSSDTFSGSVTPLSENDFLSNEEIDFVADLNPRIISESSNMTLGVNYDGNDYVDLPHKQTVNSEGISVNSCSSNSVTLLPDCVELSVADYTPSCINLVDTQTTNVGLCLADVESQPSCSSASNTFYTENEYLHDTFVVTNFTHGDVDSAVPAFCEPEHTSRDEPVHMSLAELFDSSHPIRVQAREAFTEKGHRSSDMPKSEASSHMRAFQDSMQQLKECGWYWGPLSFEEAEMKLSNKPDGSFLVRDSSNENYILSLSFKSQDIVHHTRIEHFKGKFGFWSQPESHAKSTIKEFIELAMQYSRNGNFKYFLRAQGPGLPPISMHLLYPVSRFRQMRSLQHMCRFSILQLVRRDHIEKLPVPKRIARYLRQPQYYVETIDQEMDDIVGFPDEDHNQNLT